MCDNKFKAGTPEERELLNKPEYQRYPSASIDEEQLRIYQKSMDAIRAEQMREAAVDTLDLPVEETIVEDL